MKLPALAIAISLAAGILAGSLVAAPKSPALFLGVGLVSILLAFALYAAHRPTLAWAASLLAWAVLGVAAVQLEPLAVPANHITRIIVAGGLDVSQPLRWHARLRSDPLSLPWGVRYEMDLTEVQSAGVWVPVSGGLRASRFYDQRALEDPDSNTGASDVPPQPGFRAGDCIEVLLRAAPA